MSEDTTTISLLIEVTREKDGSYSISSEDPTVSEDSDERYLEGLTEGYLFDHVEAAASALGIVKDWLDENIDRIAAPMEFRKSEG